MDDVMDGDSGSGHALSASASHARELAQDRIVKAFRAYLHGGGPGPTDSELQIFAKLAVVEHALQGDYLSHMAASLPQMRTAALSPTA